jgi:ribonuclease J
VEYELIGLPNSAADGQSFEDIVGDAVDGTIVSSPRKRRKNATVVEDALVRAVRAAVRSKWGKKPQCSVLVSVISGQ